MATILTKLLEPDNNGSVPMREVLEHDGFSKLYEGKSSKWDLTFSEEKVRPSQILVVGYDKDLDLSLEQWITSYEQKTSNDSFTIYGADIDDLASLLGGKTHTIKTSGGELSVPGVDGTTKFFIPPFKRKEFALAFSIERNLTIPAELISIMYLSDGTSVLHLFWSMLAMTGIQPEEDELKESTCTGRITLPLVLYTGKGNGNIDYICPFENLEASVEAQKGYIGEHKKARSKRLKNTVLHARRFLNKYEPLLKP